MKQKLTSQPPNLFSQPTHEKANEIHNAPEDCFDSPLLINKKVVLTESLTLLMR